MLIQVHMQVAISTYGSRGCMVDEKRISATV